MPTSAKRDDLATQQLTVERFPTFYRKILRLRFPLDVAELIEIRDIINQAADNFDQPKQTSRYRRFVSALRAEIDALGIESQRRTDRLVHILSLLRHLYYAHRARARAMERRLQRRQAANHKARKTSIKYGMLALIAAVAAVFAWFGLDEIGWPVKVVAVLLGYLCFDYFHSLSTLADDYKRLGRRLEKVRKRRVRSFKRKVLLQKIALVLGYVHPAGVKALVLSPEEEPVQVRAPRRRHALRASHQQR